MHFNGKYYMHRWSSCFLISDDSESTEMLVESLGKLGIVYKSILVKTKNLLIKKVWLIRSKILLKFVFEKK